MRDSAFVFDELVEVVWRIFDASYTAVDLYGDSELVISWLNGTVALRDRTYAARVGSIMRSIHCAWRQNALVPRTPSDNWFRHVYRELNTEADRLANLALDSASSQSWRSGNSTQRPLAVRGAFDGAHRNDAEVSCGWWLQATWDGGTWHMVAWGSLGLREGVTTVDAELSGAEQLVKALVDSLRRSGGGGVAEVEALQS